MASRRADPDLFKLQTDSNSDAGGQIAHLISSLRFLNSRTITGLHEVP
jgi:hypothetical protein